MVTTVNPADYWDIGKDYVNTFTLLSAQSMTTSEEVISTAVDLRRIAEKGIFAIHIIVTGAGTVKVEYSLSHTADNFITPSTAVDITAAFGAGDGPGGGDEDIISFEPELAPYMKIVVTGTGAGATVVTIVLGVA